MNYSLNIKDKKVTLSLSGDILGDVDIIAELNPKLDDAITKGANLCLINLAEVKFMNSSGLGLLISILTKFRNKGGDVELSNVTEQVNKLLLITKLNSIFDIK